MPVSIKHLKIHVL